MRRLAPLLLALLLLAGCKSADELYNEGQALEMQGRHEAAVRYYAEALAKDPDLQKARGRLLEAGRVAVARALDRIAAAEAAGDWTAAGDAHLALDEIVGTAGRVGVPLPLAEDYPERRRANFEAAITTLLNEGEGYVARGDFGRAIEAYERARRYRPTPDDEAALADATLDAYATWAEADLAAGHFRAAYGRAAEALALVPPGSLAAAEFARIQNLAVERGSVRTAAAPLRPSARDLPDGFLDALDDALVLDHWTRPPPFVAVLEPALVRRALRDLGLDRDPLRVRDAARLGRALETDVVFTGEVDAFRRGVEETKREERTARTRGGERVTWFRVEEEVALSAVVAFDVVDVRSGRSLCEREAERTVRHRIARGEYDGSLRVLDLSRDDRRLFDPDALAERERDLERDLADDLAHRIAELAFECILRQVR